MIRLSTLFWLILMSATGFAMFAVKYEVQALADQLAHTTRQAGQAEHASIGESAAFVGLGKSFQIWEPSRFAEHLANLRERARRQGTKIPPLAVPSDRGHE